MVQQPSCCVAGEWRAGLHSAAAAVRLPSLAPGTVTQAVGHPTVQEHRGAWSPQLLELKGTTVKKVEFIGS